jgi:hypothetical protein
MTFLDRLAVPLIVLGAAIVALAVAAPLAGIDGSDEPEESTLPKSSLAAPRGTSSAVIEVTIPVAE